MYKLTSHWSLSGARLYGIAGIYGTGPNSGVMVNEALLLSAMLRDDGVPPAQMMVQCFLPFRRTRVVHLRPLRMTYPGMDMIGAGNGSLHGFRLIL